MSAVAAVVAILGELLPSLGSRARADEAAFHMALLLLFALSVLALDAGVAAIVGAFLAGLALAEIADKRVRHPTVGIGLNFDARIFRSPGTVLLSFALLTAAVVSKMFGCTAGAISLEWRDALRVGAGMVPRGEAAVIAA